MNRKRFFALCVTLLVLATAGSALACTVTAIGKKATVDGSVMTSHTCDGWYDNRIQVIKGQSFPDGAMTPVYKEICHGTRPNLPLKKVGEIPQVKKTLTYFHVGYPFMNEKQVMIGEFTWSGRDELLCEENAWMMIEQLEVYALQRASTAREAVQIMGAIAEKYGYADGGESLTVADKNEVWLFEIAGPGPLWKQGDKKPGAVWAAVRVPDDSFFVGANRARITEVNPADKDNCMASSNVFSFAQEQGWWKPGEKFIFHKVYNPQPYGSPFYAQRREWRMLDRVVPGMKLDAYKDELPLFVKPEKKLSVREVLALYRDHLEGTPFDLSKGLAAGPFGNPNRFATPGGVRPEDRKKFDWERAISMFRCSYSFVSQSRSWLPDPVGGVLWFGEDAPDTTVYVPFYCGNTSVPKSFAEGKRSEFDPNSAFWAFQFVNNWAMLRWDAMMKDITAAQKSYEDEEFLKQASIEKQAADLYKKNPAEAVKFLTDYSNANATKVVEGWWKLGWTLVGKYHDGYITEPSGKQTSPGYPTEWLKEVGFGQTMLQPKK